MLTSKNILYNRICCKWSVGQGLRRRLFTAVTRVQSRTDCRLSPSGSFVYFGQIIKNNNQIVKKTLSKSIDSLFYKIQIVRKLMEFNKMYQKVKYIVKNVKKDNIFNYGRKDD